MSVLTFGVFRPSEIRSSWQDVHPSRWCVTRPNLVQFEREVHTMWTEGRIVRGPISSERHNDPNIGPNIYAVCEQFIKPVTTAKGARSYALMLNPKGLDCDVFVTHAWSEGVFEFCEKVLSMWPTGAKHLWCCFLSNPQNEDIGKLLGDDVYRSPFAEAMGKARHVLVVPNCDTSIYTRLWCVFEAYLALEEAKSIHMPMQVQTSSLVKMIIVCAGLFLLGNSVTSYFVEGYDVIIKCYTLSDLASASLLILVPCWDMYTDMIVRSSPRMTSLVAALLFGLLSGVYTEQGEFLLLKVISPGYFTKNFHRQDLLLLLILAAASHRCMKVLTADALRKEQGLLQFDTVLVASCSSRRDEVNIRKAIGGAEEEIDRAINVLRTVGKYNPEVRSNLQRGVAASRLRDGTSPFTVLFATVVWTRFLSAILGSIGFASKCSDIRLDLTAAILLLVVITWYGDVAIFYVDAFCLGMVGLQVSFDFLGIALSEASGTCNVDGDECAGTRSSYYGASHSKFFWVYILVYALAFLITCGRCLAFFKDWRYNSHWNSSLAISSETSSDDALA